MQTSYHTQCQVLQLCLDFHACHYEAAKCDANYVQMSKVISTGETHT